MPGLRRVSALTICNRLREFELRARKPYCDAIQRRQHRPIRVHWYVNFQASNLRQQKITRKRVYIHVYHAMGLRNALLQILKPLLNSLHCLPKAHGLTILVEYTFGCHVVFIEIPAS